LISQPWASVPPTGPLLRIDKAAEYLGYSRPQYYALAKEGLLPTPLRLIPRTNAAVGVPKPWLDAVIAAATPTELGA